MWLNGDDKSGIMVVIIMIIFKYFIFVNCGDFRVILCSNGKVIFYIVDYKLFNLDEKICIEKVGGSVMI